MFIKAFDTDSTGLIDLRRFWREPDADQHRIRVKPSQIEQLVFSKTKKIKILYSLELPEKINILVPVNLNGYNGFVEPLYKIEASPKTIWAYPSYTEATSDLIFRSNNQDWQVLSFGFPSTKQSWVLPQFKILTIDGDHRLSIFPKDGKYSEVFCTSQNLKEVVWTISSYSQPIF